MTETHTIPAQKRERAGKGAARADRRAGRIPAVIYGDKREPSAITLDPSVLDRELYKPGFFTRLFDIKIEGVRQKELAICRDVQFHPVTDIPMHLDFLRVSATTEITVMVPVHFVNEEQSPGISRGGVLNVVRHEIEMLCRASDIPPHIEVDLTGLEVGDSRHISEVKLPEGTTPTIDRDFTIATVAAPSALKAEEAEAQEAAEAEQSEGEAKE